MSRRIRYAQPRYNLPYGSVQEPEEPPLPNYPANGTLPHYNRLRTLKMVAEERPEIIQNLKNVHPVLHPNINTQIRAAMYHTDEQSMRNLFYPDDGYEPTPTKQTLNTLQKTICEKKVIIHPSNAYRLFEMLGNEYLHEQLHQTPSPFKQQLITIIKCLDASIYNGSQIRSSSNGNTPFHFLAENPFIPFEIRQELARHFMIGDLINSVNNEGTTPLALAIYNFDSEFVRFLVENGATIPEPILPVIVHGIEASCTLPSQEFQSRLRDIVNIVLVPTTNLEAQFNVFRDGDTITDNIIHHIGFIEAYIRNQLNERRNNRELRNLQQNIAFALQLFRERMGLGQEGGKWTRKAKTRKSKRTKRSKRVKTHRRR